MKQFKDIKVEKTSSQQIEDIIKNNNYNISEIKNALTNDVFNESKKCINSKDLIESGLFDKNTHYEDDDAFTFNYRNKTALISEGETYHYENGEGRNREQRWLLIVFNTEKNIFHQTTIKSKYYTAKSYEYTIKILLFLVYLGFCSCFLYAYYKQALTNSDIYLTNPIQYIIILGFPFIFILLIFLLVNKINEENRSWIKTKNIQIEKEKSTKNYEIKSSNKADALHFVTPTFLQKINKLKNSFNTDDIRCSFYRNRVLIAINIKEDLFEVADLYEPLTTKKYIRKTIKQLNAIKKIILTLDEDK